MTKKLSLYPLLSTSIAKPTSFAVASRFTHHLRGRSPNLIRGCSWSAWALFRLLCSFHKPGHNRRIRRLMATQYSRVRLQFLLRFGQIPRFHNHLIFHDLFYLSLFHHPILLKGLHAYYRLSHHVVDCLIHLTWSYLPSFHCWRREG